MQNTTVTDIVRLADDIRALTILRNGIADLQEQSGRIVWACKLTLDAYEGHTNADVSYVAQVQAMKEAATKKVRQCDKWLAENSPKLDAMVDRYSNLE